MARKTFNVDLIFGADTSRAKQAMKELNTSLKSLNDSNINKLASGINPDIEKSILKVQQLKDAFQRATDPKTGQLNLAQLNRSLEVSGQKFSDFADDFSKLGKQGQESYINMAKAISSAQQPIIKTNALVDKLWNSLKNVATWQISSTVLNSFTGAFQDAFYYAKDLNRSLNDIRIVTSYSTDKMADFAKEANKAAKSLSTTTNEYAKASLIYFQQGLSDSQVKERTDVTTKLANVSRESAETVSEWMTAIWNNFDNGTKSLEKYADTLTALGAATASSADEIATGLEKFSAVADTVGLSYDYAAAALATVTSQTRQSADVVGTAFRTLFARLEGLQLGETLDDGVTLNKYSQALNTVGVNIMNASGELKSMDTILEELGQRWGSLDQAQKVALATTVGGVRQYNTLISLMDNWGIFQDNLNISINSTGALQEQADIYAESWEAASDKVTASLETIYDQLIDDEALIDLTNMAAGFLDIVSQLIDSMGGLKGLLPGIIALMLQLFGDKMLAGAKSMTQFATMEQLKTQEQAKKLKQEASEVLGNYGDNTSITGAALQDFHDGTTKDLKELGGIFRELDDNQKELFKQILESNRSTRESMIKAAERVQSDLQDIGYKGAMGREDVLNEDGKARQFLTKRTTDIESLFKQVNQTGTKQSPVTAKKIIENNQEFFDSLGVTTNPKDPEIANKKLITTKKQLLALLDEEKAKLLEATDSVENFNNTIEKESEVTQENQKIIKNFNTKSFGENIISLTEGFSGLTFSIQSLSSIWDVLNNQDMTFGEKALQIVMSLSMALPMLSKSLEILNASTLKDTVTTGANTLAKWLNTLAIEDNSEAKVKNAKNTQENSEEIDKDSLKTSLSTIGKNLTNKTTWKNIGIGAGKLAIYAAAIMLVVGAAKALYDTGDKLYNRDKNRLDAAAQSAEAASEELKKTREEYKSLQDTINNYKNNVNAIESLTKGTIEHRNAIREANEEAAALIEKYGVLAQGDYGISADGLLYISEEGLQKMLDAQQAEYVNTLTYASQAKQSKRDAQSQYNQTLYTRNQLKTSSWGEFTDEERSNASKGAGIGAGVYGTAGVITGAVLGAKLGTGLGAFAGPVGAAIGAVAGVAAGALYGAIAGWATTIEDTTSKEKDALDKIYKEYEKIGDAALTDQKIDEILVNIDDEELVKQLKENKTGLKELMIEMQNNTAIRRQENLILAAELNSMFLGGFKYLSDDDKSALNAVTARHLENIQNQRGSGADKDFSGGEGNPNWNYTALGFLWTGRTEEGEAAFEKWSQNNGKGYQNIQIENFNEEGVEFSYYDQDNNKNNEGFVTYTEIYDLITSLEANETAKQRSPEAQNILNEISNRTYAKGINSIISGTELINLNEKEVEAFRKTFESGELNSFIRENYSALGYNSIEAFTEAIANGIDNYDPREALAAFTKKTEAEIDRIFEGGAQEIESTSGALENYAKVLAKSSQVLSEYADGWEKLEDKKLAAKVAVYNAKFAKGVQELNKVLEENIETLFEWNENSLDLWESVDKVQTALESVFGVRVSSEYVQEYFKEIQQLAIGNTESLEELEQAAARDYIINLDITDEAKHLLSKGVEDLLQEIKEQNNGLDIEVGASFNDSEYINKLNEMIKKSELTAEQVAATFGAIGYSPDIRTFQQKQESTTHFSGHILGDKNKPFEGEFSTTTWVDVPYIAGSNTQAPEVTEINSSTGKQEVVETAKYSGTGLTAMGNADSKRAALSGLLNDTTEERKKREVPELDRYHEINEALDDIKAAQDRLSKAKDRAWGPDKLKYLEDEEELLREELKLLEDENNYLSQIDKYYSTDRQEAAKYGAIFDSEGRISNYEELMSKYRGELESAKNSTNDETWSAMSEKYNLIEETFKQYEETLNLWEKTQDEIIEKNAQLKDLALEKIEYKIEYKIEIDEDEIKHLDYLIAAAGESVDKAADRIANLGRKYEIANNQIAIYEEGVRQVFGESYTEDLLSGNVNLEEVLASGQLTDKQIEMLRNYRDELYNINDILKETAETINENLVNALDEMNEEYEKSYDNLEHLDKIYKSYKDIVDIVGKNKLGISNEAIRQMTQAQLENANAALKIAEAQKNAAQSNYDEIANLYKQDNEMYKEAMQEAEEALEEAQENFMDRWQTALTAAADAFKENVELIAEEFSSAVGGIYGSIENMSQAFDRQKQIGELYFQDYKKVYEISKLNRQITQTMEKNDNVKSQRQYNELLAEVNEYSKEGVKMSEYDLGYLQKKYDLIQAQMALEEAQNAKNQMTLQRDSEGNWGYVYTADQSKIDDSKQKYEDAVYAMQDFKWQSEMELQGQYLDYIQQYEEGLLALAEKYGTESEEYKKGADELAAHFSALTGYTLEELQEMVDRGLGLYNEFGVKTAQAYEETILGQMNTSLGSFSKLQEDTNKAITDSINALKLSHESFSLKVSETFDNAGSSVDGFKTEYTNAANTASTEADNIVTKTGEMQIKFSSSFGLMVESITKWYNTYGTVIDSITGPEGKNDKLIKSIDEVIKKYEEFHKMADITVNPPSDTTQGSGNGTLATENGGGPPPVEKEEAGKQNKRLKELFDLNTLDFSSKGINESIKNNSGFQVHKNSDGGYAFANDVARGYGVKDISKYLTSDAKALLEEEYNNDLDALFNSVVDPENFVINGKEPVKIPEELTNTNKIQQLWVDHAPGRDKHVGPLGQLYTIKFEEGDYFGSVSANTFTFEELYQKGAGGVLTYKGQDADGRYKYKLLTKDGKRHIDLTEQGAQKVWFGQYPYSTEEGQRIWHLADWFGMQQFFTGGYTGEWGPEGRLAMLHQKEIVLNATDTENLLRTIDMVRSFNDRVEQSARMAALGLSNIGGIASYPRGGDTLQQEVTIHAEFPNVTDHNEIELALNNLVNDASQYANRKD